MAKRRRKKAQYRTNPITGQREKVLRQGEYRNPFTGEISRPPKRPRSRRSYSRRPRKASKEEQLFMGIAILLVIVGFAIYQAYLWMSTHIWQTVLIFAVIIGGIVLLFTKVPRFREMLRKKFETYGPVKDEQVQKLVSVIKQMKTQEVRNEEDFEKQLYQRLDALGYQVERQVKRSNRKIDMVVNSKIAVELKLADRAKPVQDLIGQVTVYKQYYKNILVVILDVGRVPELDNFIKMIRNVDPENVTVVVVQGDIRRYQKKSEYIMVKKSTSYQ